LLSPFNDEVNHHIAFVELPDLVVDPDKLRHARLQHVAFEYQTVDDLLGTYGRLKGLGILPCWPPIGHGIAIIQHRIRWMRRVARL
jgi:hypothetical protein